MDREQPPWMLLHLVMVLPALAASAGPLTDLENVAGKLVFYQTEGNATYVRDTGELASHLPTETMFELYDPPRNFSAAKFTYTWDLGNGEVIEGSEPVVRYLYPRSGNYTLRLKVGADTAQSPPPITGIYSKEVQVLDAIRKVELAGPADYTVSRGSSLAFHVDGSPPMWLCWRFLSSCLPDAAAGCTLTMIYENTLELNHTFTSTGLHCLDISVRNEVSKLQTSFSLYVRRNDNAQLLFILSCAAVLVATFCFILAVACRPWKQNASQVASSRNATFLRDAGGESKMVVRFSSVEKGEQERLLLPNGTFYSS